MSKGIANLGLIFITFLAAIQYIFLKLVPEDFSSFAFLAITNIMGLVILGLANIKKLLTLGKETLKKGLVFGLELTVSNLFLLLASRTMDSVMLSSVYSMYFIFVTPILLLKGKKVSLFSGIASVTAIMALMLMFNADTGENLLTMGMLYLIVADLFFAIYVVSVSILGENENPGQLTMAQMLVSAVLAVVCWAVEVSLGKSSFNLSGDGRFWIAVVFYGVFIRALYGIIQIGCQKYVPAINASLIFSAEIIFTLIMNPILSKLLGTDYTQTTVFQVIGCILFVASNLLLDNGILEKIGYHDLNLEYGSSDIIGPGKSTRRVSVAVKIITLITGFTMITLIASTVVSVYSIQSVRTNTLENMEELGDGATDISEKALKSELEQQLVQQVEGKAMLAESRLDAYGGAAMFAADYASALYSNPENFGDMETDFPREENGGIWTMQRMLLDESMSYEDVMEENRLQGNMYNAFKPIVDKYSDVLTIYIGTETGLMNSYDEDSHLAAGDGDVYYDFHNADWYKLGRETEGYAFTSTYKDSFGRGLTITCVAPVRDDNGKFMGCVGIDFLMDDINRILVSEGVSEPARGTLITDEGAIIASTSLESNMDSLPNIRDGVVNPYLVDVADEILGNDRGVLSTGEGDSARYVSYAHIPEAGWIMLMSSPIKTVIQPVYDIRDNIADHTLVSERTVVEKIITMVQVCLTLSATALILIAVLAGRFSRKISDPLKQLERDVNEISAGRLDMRTEVSTDDEIGMLALSFNDMTESLQQHIKDLQEVTAREQRIASELEVATKIQADMLPRNFDAYPEFTKITLDASMDPAKEVGGDFYDFFKIDDRHMGLVIADVSGKGVPAALFMVISKTLVKNQTLLSADQKPSDILSKVNDQLCEGNDTGLFCTCWLGILDVETGHMVCSNAGHEFPFLRNADGVWEMFMDPPHKPALAVMEGIPYNDYEMDIVPGGALFVYTDGVPEATNSGDELFGNDRTLTALNLKPMGSPGDILVTVKEEVDKFVAEAPQFDDLTMLCVEFAKA